MNIEAGVPFPTFLTDQRRYAGLALEITDQEWTLLGQEDVTCPNVAASSDIDVTAERVTALLLMRLVALAAPSHKFDNLSTLTICKTILRADFITSCWPESITEQIVQQLRSFVRATLKGYNKVEYHNFEHSYHVVVSANKILDLILRSKFVDPVKSPSEGLEFEQDPLLHLALIFAALIHDVEHQGVPNQQLVIENDPLAIQYNDQSVAEQRSLSVGFAELLKTEYKELREVMFPFTFNGDGYRRFRETVKEIVLATDISSPERSAIVRKKWEDSFREWNLGDVPRQRVLISDDAAKGGSDENLLLKSPIYIPPPREHPTPLRKNKTLNVGDVPREIPNFSPKGEHKKVEKIPTPKLQSPTPSKKSTKETEKSVRDSNRSLGNWIENGRETASRTPKDAASSVAHDSLVFWWFCPQQSDEESEADSTIEDESNHDDRKHDDHMIDDVLLQSMRSMTSQIQRIDEDEEDAESLGGPIQLSDSYNYPDMEQSIQGSTLFDPSETTDGCCFGSDADSDEEGTQHLLSSSKLSKFNSSFHRRVGTASLSGSFRETGTYSDLGEVSDEQGTENEQKPKGLLGALVGCAQRRKHSNQKLLMEMRSSMSKLSSSFRDSNRSIDVTGTDTTAPASSRSFHISSAESSFRLEPSSHGQTELGDMHKLDCSMQIFDGHASSLLDMPMSREEEERRSVSLLEHILLIADVAHNLQGWDLMVKFSHRLSKEIQASIDAGRSGGIVDDPLGEWYTNQSAFLHRYVLPLVLRLEQTGYIPEMGSGTFLSDVVYSNLDRWQEDGHDIVHYWRKLRDRKKLKKSKSKSSSKKKKDDNNTETEKEKEPKKKTKDSKKNKDSKKAEKKSSKKDKGTTTTKKKRSSSSKKLSKDNAVKKEVEQQEEEAVVAVKTTKQQKQKLQQQEQPVKESLKQPKQDKESRREKDMEQNKENDTKPKRKTAVPPPTPKVETKEAVVSATAAPEKPKKMRGEIRIEPNKQHRPNVMPGKWKRVVPEGRHSAPSTAAAASAAVPKGIARQ